MSLSELERTYGPPGEGPAEERLPPQDVAAEQSALGAMLLSKDAIGECSEIIKPVDFYRPAHERIYEAVVDLFSRGEPVDAITVADELTKRGELTRVGGTAYLHQLIAGVPTAANAAFYAEIVAERAVLRRLVEAGTRIVQIGYGGGDVEEIVNTAQAEIYAVADKRGGEDYHALADLIQPTTDEIEHNASSTGEMVGVPTGFNELDELTNGLHAGQMVIVAARPAVGKALALDTPLPTPSGWTTMGEVRVGDQLLGADGRPTTVVAATEVMHDRPCYEVEFSDGSVITADAEHLWDLSLGEDAEPATVTTTDVKRAVAEGARVSVARPEGDLDAATWTVTAVTPVTSVPVRCLQVDDDRHLFLAGRSMIPTHNSTFALDIARAAAIKHGLPTVVFSLEMSRTEITMRLLSAESEIPLQNMRKGNMRDRDWTRLAETQGRIHDAPLFIDDSPNMSLMEIRAKCRRLKQRNDLKLVVVDYLQLMSSGKRVESRQQEVAEFSRALKLLAKELEVPLIALSQLNRGPEQRTDKKPQMSDLRESGCLTADTRILRADTGSEVTMGELHESGERDVPVWSLDESLRYVRRHLTHVFPTGTRPVFRLTLTSGKTVRATENHPFLTYDGWKQLGDLRAGDRVAVPRHVPAPEKHEPWSDDDQVRTLARDLGSGRLDLPPDTAAHMSKRQIGLLLGSLWNLGGAVRIVDGGVVIDWTGPAALADHMSRQLLRFGISTRRRSMTGTATLAVVEKDDQRRFLREIAPLVDLGPEAAPALALVEAGEIRTEPRAVLDRPAPLWQEMARVLEQDTTGGALATVVDVLDTEDFDLAAVNDVLFDDVVSVELDGVEEVFDATVLGNHNFVANGIAVHNSIEQDADVVILLHRESMYERESPREGEADVIVAKHRNGPTDTVVVAFQGHYSRFTNMASNF
ncbi:replicative DNA helicase [Ornithinimicrobium kibberense]|uniref:Replicative DNA helicase n=1 Tax=Ornithinimicrobium kibberense TaxID=282060 RepID=A0ABV5V5U3_9MICO|nr:replicative DNA helicase [Ornithinimicrobium kibberense]